MTTSTTETVPKTARGIRTDSGADKPTTRAQRTRTNGSEEDSSGTRYFLAKANGDGNTPALDREAASEGEALVEALRSGVTYYAIQGVSRHPGLRGQKATTAKGSRSWEVDCHG
jgi:hypothetical protein